MVLPVLPELVHQPRVTADLVEQGVVPLLGVEVLADGGEVDPDDLYTGLGEPLAVRAISEVLPVCEGVRT